jgi:hypothetical protein
MVCNGDRIFLVIGAAKAGTTTFYRDIGLVDGIGTHPTKEPNLLTEARPDNVILRDLNHFLSGGAGMLGDFSTTYAMAMTYPGVPERAHRLLGDDVPIFYLVRDPIQRIISHHHHYLARGKANPDIDRALREDPLFLDASLYGHQLGHWEEVFGSGRVNVIVFEDYIADRAGSVGEIATRLGLVPPRYPPGDEVYNAQAGGRVARGIVQRCLSSRFYSLWGRRLLPGPLRRGAGSYLLHDAGPRRFPTADTLKWLQEKFEPDVSLLSRQLGWEKAPWDLDATVKSLLEMERT